MAVPRLTEKQKEDIIRLVLTRFRRYSPRVWQEWDPTCGSWRWAHHSQVRALIQGLLEVTDKGEWRPLSHISELYDYCGFLAMPEQRKRWFEENYPDITLND